MQPEIPPARTGGVGPPDNGYNGAEYNVGPDESGQLYNRSAAEYRPIEDQAAAGGALTTVDALEKLGGYRVRIGGDIPEHEALQDAAVLAFEYERRRAEWWRRRRLGLVGLPSVVAVLLFITAISFLLGPEWSGRHLPAISLAGLLLISWLIFAVYCWVTLPRVLSFGRAYRRLVSIPLARGGIVWCDGAVPAPNFPSIRDSYFTLYNESHEVSARTQPSEQAGETERKKRTMADLQTIIKPARALAGNSGGLQTPFIARDQAIILDRVELEELPWHDLTNLKLRSLPQTMYHVNTPPELLRLAHDVENYSSTRAEVEPPVDTSIAVTPPPLHGQISTRINENLTLVSQEIERWREQAGLQKSFQIGLMARYSETAAQANSIYEQSLAALEEEISPAIRQLTSDAKFYKEQIQSFYQTQQHTLEAQRDASLAELVRIGGGLEAGLEEKSDEHSLLQAEYRSQTDQRNRLEASTDNRFSTLKGALRDLIHRSYALPTVPIFHSDYPVELTARTADQCLQQVAELRVETRQATAALNRALNNFARVRYEPLDELAQLQNQISQVSKWQSVAYLGSLINFRQIGQLLELASEVSNIAGIYLEAVTDFDQLNRRWCELEISIRSLGLSSYAGRLQEAQDFLMSLQQLISSLHSNLISAAHNPDMARPGIFQSIYEQAIGLQRELEELGSLTGQLERLEENLSFLSEELSGLTGRLEKNRAELEQAQNQAAAKLTELSRQQQVVLEKLDELQISRLQRLRSHVDGLLANRDQTMKSFKSGASVLKEVASTADSMLRQHLMQGEVLLEEARRMHKGLEQTLASIVSDFEASVMPDRFLAAPSELMVPVWYFQFKERPLWQARMMGFASCYMTLNRSAAFVGRKNRSSLWRYLTSSRPATYYRLQDDSQLETLIGALNLEYPAGRIDATPEWVNQLTDEGWLSRWGARVLNRAIKPGSNN